MTEILVKDGSAPRVPARDIGGMRRKASGYLVGCAGRHSSVLGGATDCNMFELAPHN